MLWNARGYWRIVASYAFHPEKKRLVWSSQRHARQYSLRCRAHERSCRWAGCLAIEPFSIQDFARAIGQFSDAPDQEIVSRGLACRQRVQVYRWDSIARRSKRWNDPEGVLL